MGSFSCEGVVGLSCFRSFGDVLGPIRMRHLMELDHVTLALPGAHDLTHATRPAAGLQQERAFAQTAPEPDGGNALG